MTFTEVPCATCGPDRTFDDPADCPTCAGTRLDYVATFAPILKEIAAEDAHRRRNRD